MSSPKWLLALIAVLLLGIAACGGGMAQAPATGPVVQGLFGPVTTPAAPKRVVALGWGDGEAALALGVQPVGISDWLGFGGSGVGPWATDEVTTTPKLLGGKDVSLEAVAALQPDLILWTRAANDEAVYQKLSAIAPTVTAPPGVATAYGTTWSQQVRQVAAALGRPADGDALVAGVDKRYADLRAAHPGWQGRTAAVGVLNVQRIAAYVGSLRTELMGSLGFVTPPELAKQKAVNFSVDLGTENAGLLDADVTVLLLIGVDGAAARANPVLTGIPSAKAGRLLVMDDPVVSKAISSGTVLSLGAALDALVPTIEAVYPGR